MDEHTCSVCGKKYPNEAAVKIDLKLKNEFGKTYEESLYVLKMFGKLKFTICFTCWLLSLNVRADRDAIIKHLNI